jgi:hypothetical protein
MDEPSDSGLPDDEDDDLVDDESTAFPASEATPGQHKSRSSYARFRQWVDGINTEDGKALDFPKVLLKHKPGEGILKKKPAWLDEYQALRAEGWDWRKAAFIAWAASPTINRWPDNQKELATRVLGLKADRTIRKWRENDPRIDERIGRLQIEPMWQHRRDVLDTLITVAKLADPKAHPDRRMFLEMTGDYKPKGQIALTNPAGGPVQLEQIDDYADLNDEQLEQVIDNLAVAS